MQIKADRAFQAEIFRFAGFQTSSPGTRWLKDGLSRLSDSNSQPFVSPYQRERDQACDAS
jgi:hypothetical protein